MSLLSHKTNIFLFTGNQRIEALGCFFFFSLLLFGVLLSHPAATRWLHVTNNWIFPPQSFPVQLQASSHRHRLIWIGTDGRIRGNPTAALRRDFSKKKKASLSYEDEKTKTNVRRFLKNCYNWILYKLVCTHSGNKIPLKKPTTFVALGIMKSFCVLMLPGGEGFRKLEKSFKR